MSLGCRLGNGGGWDVPLTSSRRKPGPITTGSNCLGKAVNHRFKQHPPRRMGPGFRRDDVGIDTSPPSRGMFSPEVFQFVAPLRKRGRRECRVHAAPAVSCAKNCTVGAHEHTGQRKHSDIPCAMALRLISRSPRWSGLVVTVISGTLPANLAPASRRQDHTTSPYALAFSSGVKKRLTPKRPSHPAPHVS